MKLRIFGIALASLVLASLYGGAFAQRARTHKHNIPTVDRWYIFVSPDGDFTLSFLQKPSREPDGQGRTPIKSFGLYTENLMRFSINGTSINPLLSWSYRVRRGGRARNRTANRNRNYNF